jgi:hypothetical protein
MSRNLRPIVFLAILFAAALTLWPASADAQGRARGGRPVVVVRGGFGMGFSPFYDPFFYSPFYGPWGPYGSPYASNMSEVRIQATPKDAEVFVDGYYAGIVDNFDGVFQRLNVSPGGHEFVLYREGFQPIHQMVYVQPGSSFTLRHTMVPLAAGESMAPRPVPPAAARPMGMQPGQRMPGRPPQAGPPAGY